MNRSRRNFVRHAGTAITAAVVVPGAVTAAFGQITRNAGLLTPPVQSTLDPLTYLTPDHFTPFVGTAMQARSSSGRRVSFQLTEVKNTQLEQNEKRGYVGQSYSLMFESSMHLPGEIYVFNHKLLGTFSLFVSPIDRKGVQYEAAVNRIAPNA